MLGIFISYRREDSAGFAGRLSDALEARFGIDQVFRDVQDIQPGEDFTQAINRALKGCSVLLAVIGRRWAGVAGSLGKRRIDDPGDFLRIELKTALGRGVPVVPVLVDGAKMPSEHELPSELAPLSRLQAQELTDPRWRQDVDALITSIERLTGLTPAAPAAAVAEVTGLWQFPRGNRWLITQSGAGFQIEELRADGGGLWAKGSGVLRGDTLETSMDLVYSDACRFFGRLRLAPDGRSLAGVITEVVSGSESEVHLERL